MVDDDEAPLIYGVEFQVKTNHSECLFNELLSTRFF